MQINVQQWFFVKVENFHEMGLLRKESATKINFFAEENVRK